MLPFAGIGVTFALLALVPTVAVVASLFIELESSPGLTTGVGAIVSLAAPALICLWVLMHFGKC